MFETEEIILLTTLGTLEQGKTFGRSLVEARLAACVNCLPGAVSFYRWQSDEITEDQEILLMIKTSRQKRAELRQFFKEHHPYDCPEWIELNIQTSEPYSQWLRGELRLDS